MSERTLGIPPVLPGNSLGLEDTPDIADAGQGSAKLLSRRNLVQLRTVFLLRGAGLAEEETRHLLVRSRLRLSGRFADGETCLASSRQPCRGGSRLHYNH